MGWVVVLIVIAAVVAAFFILAIKLATYIMTINKKHGKTLERAWKIESGHMDLSFYNKIEKEDYTIKGVGGYILHVQFLKNPKPTAKYMILTHGHNDNRIGSLKYVPMYMELGFNCVIYDMRCHGLNKRTYFTYGILESKDLMILIKDTRVRHPDMTQLGLHGESLGSATTVTTMKYRPKVDFAVCDCGFADLWNVLKVSAREYHLPQFFLYIAEAGVRMKYHYSFKQMNPIDSLGDNEIPMLFIHGTADSYIVPSNSQRMADRTKGYSEVHFVQNAKHAMSYYTDPVNYKKYVADFLKKIE